MDDMPRRRRRTALHLRIPRPATISLVPAFCSNTRTEDLATGKSRKAEAANNMPRTMTQHTAPIQLCKQSTLQFVLHHHPFLSPPVNIARSLPCPTLLQPLNHHHACAQRAKPRPATCTSGRALFRSFSERYHTSVPRWLHVHKACNKRAQT